MGRVMVALSLVEAGPWHKEACRSPGAPGEKAKGKQWVAEPFSEKTSAHKVVRYYFERIGANWQLFLQKATCEPAELAQGSPRLESDEELLSMGGECEDDRTATHLHPAEETTWTKESAKCTFCSALAKPIPTVLDLKERPQENFG
ncbi:uncharacterized protein LJ206_002579 [Theristicus caerulescens]